MNKQFVTFEIAKQLKELGFDEPCLGLFHKDGTLYTTEAKTHEQYHGQVCSAPLWQQVTDWLRDGHEIILLLDNWTEFYHFSIWYEGDIYSSLKYSSYPEAREHVILEALSLINKLHKP